MLRSFYLILIYSYLCGKYKLIHLKMRAKFTCYYVNEFEGEKMAYLSAVIDGEENKSWAAATPVGSLQITISEETQAKDFFKQGKDYILDFSEAE